MGINEKLSKLDLPNKYLRIAIDGTAACGKGAVAQALSKLLRIPYLDTGSLYRGAAVHFLNNGVYGDRLQDMEAVRNTLDTLNLGVESHEDGSALIFLNGENISDRIRLNETSEFVPYVAKIPIVREKIMEKQEEAIANGHIIMEGRNIGSEIMPGRDVLKFFITTDANVAFERRYPQERARNKEIQDLEQEISCIEQELAQIQQQVSEQDISDMEQKLVTMEQIMVHYDMRTSLNEQQVAALVSINKQKDLEIAKLRLERIQLELKLSLEERDRTDLLRHNSPLIRVEDAIFVDSSTMTLDDTIDFMLLYIREHVAKYGIRSGKARNPAYEVYNEYVKTLASDSVQLDNALPEQ